MRVLFTAQQGDWLFVHTAILGEIPYYYLKARILQVQLKGLVYLA